MKTRRRYLLLATLALALAACGGGVADDDPASLPINDDPAAGGGAAAGACLAGEPDCDDMGVDQGAEPLPLPGDDGDGPGGSATSGGMVVAPLTVSEALAGDVAGVIAVQGAFFDDGSGPRLCDVLAESFPPQCGGDSLPVSGFEEVIDVPLQTEQGVTWTDQAVTFLGEIVDGVLVVDPTVTG